MTRNFDTSLHVVDETYAWSECADCGNTIKFGEGATVHTACPACGARYSADREKQTVSLDYMPSDEEFWAENDDIDY